MMNRVLVAVLVLAQVAVLGAAQAVQVHPVKAMQVQVAQHIITMEIQAQAAAVLAVQV